MEEAMAEVLVMGAGLTGGLAALALAEAGAAVTLLAPAAAAPAACSLEAAASHASYGGVPPWAGAPHPGLQRLAATADSCWQELESRHGPLGWSPCRLWLHWPAAAERRGEAAAARQNLRQLGVPLPADPAGAGLGEWVGGEGRTQHLALAYSRVDSCGLRRGLEPLLTRLCRVVRGRVTALEPAGAGTKPGWRLRLSDGRQLQAQQVVLAAGAGLASLMQAPPQRWRWGWAGVLRVPPQRLAAAPWLELARQGDIVMPLVLRRHLLEARSERINRCRGSVDAGLASCGPDLLLGQDTWVGPGLRLDHPPDPIQRERRLRRGLARALAAPELAHLDGRFEQMPVSFCLDGLPLVGQHRGPQGLWWFTGFSGGYALVPPLAPLLAAAIGGDRQALAPLADLAG